MTLLSGIKSNGMRNNWCLLNKLWTCTSTRWSSTITICTWLVCCLLVVNTIFFYETSSKRRYNLIVKLLHNNSNSNKCVEFTHWCGYSSEMPAVLSYTQNLFYWGPCNSHYNNEMLQIYAQVPVNLYAWTRPCLALFACIRNCFPLLISYGLIGWSTGLNLISLKPNRDMHSSYCIISFHLISTQSEIKRPSINRSKFPERCHHHTNNQLIFELACTPTNF